jgi:hypothetical protein
MPLVAPLPPPTKASTPEAFARNNAISVVEPSEPSKSTQKKPNEPERRPLDDSISRILREEAARETLHRREEAGTLETQTDLGLQVSASQKKPVGAHESLSLLDEVSIKKNLQPPIQERPIASINKPEIRLSKAVSEAEKIAPKEKESAFWPTFFLVLGLGVLATLLYINSPRIATSSPILAPHAQLYVIKVDQLRVSLVVWDTIARTYVTAWIDLGLEWLKPIMALIWLKILEIIGPIDPVVVQVKELYMYLSSQVFLR